eukprot:6149871-Prymnesium_polylepis.1
MPNYGCTDAVCIKGHGRLRVSSIRLSCRSHIVAGWVALGRAGSPQGRHQFAGSSPICAAGPSGRINHSPVPDDHTRLPLHLRRKG